jgi:C-terminal processing protease CtpA/Prc
LSVVAFLAPGDSAGEPRLAGGDEPVGVIAVQASEDEEPGPKLPEAEAEADAPSGRAWLGVELQDLDPALREAFDFEGPGVLVTRVISGGPADRGGLARGDIITSVDGGEVQSASEVIRRIRAQQPGDTIKVIRIRKGDKDDLQVQLAAAPERLGSQRRGPMPWASRSYLGARVERLNPDLASYFDVEPETGVLVVSVQEDSPAARAGLKAGDVIRKIGSEPVRSPEALANAVQAEDPGTVIEITAIRHGKEQKLQATLAEAPPAERLRSLARLRGEDFGPMLHDLRDRMNEGGEALSERMDKLEQLFRDLEQRLEKKLEEQESK